MTEVPVLGIVVPTLNEELRLPRLLGDLQGMPISHCLVVSDGGSNDETVRIAEQAGARVVHSAPGRARQMNAGAAQLDTPWLLFLHADSRLDAPAARALTEWVRTAAFEDVGAFGFALEGDAWFWRFIEFGQRLRQRMYGLAYGDQGLVVSSERFRTVGGFPEQSLLEDVEILRRLKRNGRLRAVPANLITSPRRYEAEGRWFAWLRNTATIGLYQLGVSAEHLAGWYRPREDASPSKANLERTRLLVFAKAPRPGTVKTRLARDVGDHRAAEIYRHMGTQILGAVAGGPYGVTVCFDPPDARPDMVEWLGGCGSDREIEFRPQAPGDLGARMAEALNQALRTADRVCVIGTDAPGVDAALVRSAFAALESADCVIGPAEDGGYYLIGLRQNHPTLFQDIEWSTPRVFEQTLAHASSAGLSIETLETLVDVDVLEDLPADLRD